MLARRDVGERGRAIRTADKNAVLYVHMQKVKTCLNNAYYGVDNYTPREDRKILDYTWDI